MPTSPAPLLPTPPFYETARLQSLRELFILDTSPEPVFDSLAQMASAACGTPL
ncbi:MAG: hypothetical protein JWP29_2772, partial [Rhodoferax sp.]|nr:hypothetical protein [Rhodoferax sp.]